ncbi:MAG: hemagglutinin, partial [Spirochaetales bacterium]|nr:hemagglutinin [Spirochaetales bacterium]
MVFLCAALFILPLSLHAQSRIPAEASNYIQATGVAGNGDPDPYMVVFYEVPDTVTSTLYFAISDPGLTGVSPDQGTGGTWTYYLVGGSGTLSSATSRQLTFASLTEATTGTILDTKNYTTETGWQYFSGVSPSQGEKIGNKYYFKIVAAAPNGNKNGFQLDVSYSTSGNPTGSTEIRAFAYCWTLALLNNAGTTWNLYPFVPDSATGDISYVNWDMDSGEALAAWNKSGTSLTAPTVSGEGTTWSTSAATTNYTIGTETNGTWRLQVTEGSGTEPAINTSMFWFENPSGTILRTYAAPYTPPAPYAVTINPQSTTALTGSSPSFTLQIVDSNGNPVPYVRNVYVTVNGSASIAPNNNGTAAAELLSTGGDGLATFTVTDAAAEPVTVRVYWDGTGGSSSFGSSGSTTASVTFQSDLLPSISSASNLTYRTDQAPVNLPVITITDSGTANITAANDIRIRFSSALSAEFLTTVTSPTLTVGGTGGGIVGGTVSYPDSRTILIDVTTDFAVTNTLTIGSGTPLQIDTTTDAASSGRLELSVNGGTVWTSVDDKIITILDTNPTYVWNGNTNTSWTTDTNWAGGTAPSLNDGTENIIIPSGCSQYPVLPAVAWSINQLTIDTGASLTIGANNLTINGTLNNTGTLVLSGAGRPNKVDVDSGTVRYTVAGGSVT